MKGVSRTPGSTCAIRIGRCYFPLRLITHSAIPVSMPSATSGRIHSRDAPITYASTANTQHEPTTHKAIAKESGSLSTRTPFGRSSTEITPTERRAPVGVISGWALEGESRPRYIQDIAALSRRASQTESTFGNNFAVRGGFVAVPLTRRFVPRSIPTTLSMPIFDAHRRRWRDRRRRRRRPARSKCCRLTEIRPDGSVIAAETARIARL